MAAVGMAAKSLYRCGTGHSSDLTTSGKEHIIRDRKGAAGRRLPFKNVWLRNSRSFLQDGAVISFDRKTGKPTPQCQSAPNKREWILSTLFCFILFCGLQKACTATISRPFMIQDSKKAAKSCGFFPIDKKIHPTEQRVGDREKPGRFSRFSQPIFYRPVDGFSLMGISLFVMVQVFPR